MHVPAGTECAPFAIDYDDAHVRGMLQSLLSARGFSVTVAADGAAARSVLNTVRPDLILLDYNMPGETGDLVCARIKAEVVSAEAAWKT